MHGGGLRVAALGLASFASVAALVPLVRGVALGYGITDRPGNGKIHTAVTPYLGGLAILLTALGVSSFLPEWSAQGVAILVGAAVVGIVGLVDDVRTLGPGPRLAIEAMAASLAFATGARVHLVNDPVDWFITVSWLVVLTNSFNLLDNMDGVAGVVATGTAVALAVAAALGGQVLVGGLAAIVAGSCAGFLLYNWHPARIFLGDAGSLFLGFILASLALKLRFAVGPVGHLVAVILLVAPALFDTTLVVLARWREGRPIYVGGTDHTTHRLLHRGLPTRSVAGVLAAGTALCATLGVAVGRGAVTPWVAAPIVLIGAALLLTLLRQSVPHAVARDHAPAPRPLPPASALELLPPPLAAGAWGGLDFLRAGLRGRDERSLYLAVVPTNVSTVEPQGPHPSDDLDFRWPREGNGRYRGAPAEPPERVQWPFADSRPTEPPHDPPVTAPLFTAPPPPVPAPPEPAVETDDWSVARSEIRSIVRMGETVLDTLASQLRQDEQSARLFTQHLSSVEGELERLSERLDATTARGNDPTATIVALEGQGSAIRRLENAIQALAQDLQQLQNAPHSVAGLPTALAEHAATLRAVQGDLTAVLADQGATLRSLQSDLTAALSEQRTALRSLKGDTLEPGAVHGEFANLRSELLANQERQFASLVGIVREAVSEEVRRARHTGGAPDAVAEQAAALRSLQGDLTAVLSEQAAAIRSLQASGLDAKSLRADIDRSRSELLANQERMFGNLVGVVRTLLQQSEDVVVALGRVPKSSQAGRAFEMLKLSSGGWEGSEHQR